MPAITQVSLEELKRRAAPPLAEQPVATPAARQMPAELQQQIDKFAADLAEANAPVERLDIGPIPEEARKKIEERQRQATPSGAAIHKVFDTALRAGVERRCSPMEFGDLVITNRVTQIVPVLLKKLSVEFQSLIGTETFWLDRMAIMQPEEFRGTWISHARLTMMVKAINGKVLEPHINKNGEIDTEAFDRKLVAVLRMGDRVVELLLINMTWFNFRVEALFDDDFEALKNG